MRVVILVCCLLLLSCGGGKPENVVPVATFDLPRYLGIWYEIARLDHRFERGLTHVTAEYSLRDDGGVKVVNRGYSHEKGEWEQAIGKAYFVETPKIGFLKVSFWGPFYSSYIVVELDEIHYQYALVSGADKDYLWILARTPELNPTVYDRLVEKAKSLGFPTHELIKVDHSVTEIQQVVQP